MGRCASIVASFTFRMIHYIPPSVSDLQRLKAELGLTGQQMAELVNVAGSQQWRKYTGGALPRDLSMHALFFLSARLALTDEELERIGDAE